ncbi:MAG: Transcriptional regulator, PadR family [Acetothermia bacterium 64_32]|nr:MAG: Transcriptional regulator, PadR family [Acetothermia bacterium 64_32]
MKGLPVGYAVLGALLSGPAHGYELKRRLNSGLGPIWHIAQSQLYSVLARLEREGLVEGHLEPQGARPPRRVFSLTQAGESAFWDWATSPVRHVRDVRIELFAKLYFLRRHAPDRVPELLSAQAERLTRLKDRLSQRKALPTDDPALARLTLDFRRTLLSTLLSWLEEAKLQLLKEVQDA